MPYEKAFEVFVESEEPVFETGTIVTVYWSPQSIFPLADPQTYTVDITMREFDTNTGEWNTLATLASDLTNNGEAKVTVPELPTVETVEDSINQVVIEVSVSSASVTDSKRGHLSNVLSKIGQFGLRILRQAPMRIIKRPVGQAAQRLACEAWALTQSESTGTQITNPPPETDTGTQINNRLLPCPCTVDRARAPNSGFREERLSSVIKVIGRVQKFLDTAIIDDAFRNYFHPGAASCYRQRVTNP